MSNTQTIEQQALQTYQENLLFFQETQPNLFRKINSFNQAVEKGYYQQRYSLEYKDEGYFDVLELETGKFLYGSDSNKYASLAAQSIDFTKQDNLFETFYNLSFDEVNEQDLLTKDVIKYSYSTVASLINYSNKHASKENTTMIKLYKFIFIGVGLGTHISTIDEKLHSNVYLLVEDDLELFHLSMFVTNYKDLTRNGAELFFSVFEEPSEFKNTVQSFLYAQFIYNHYIKFFHMLHHNEKRIKEIQNIIVTQTYLTFNYAALMTSLLRPLEYLKNSYKILNLNASYENTPLTQKPVLIIGAGPSFDKNTEWLKNNHQKFIIVIVSALMAKFEELNIKPDIITHVHGFEDAMPHIEKVKDIHFFDETIELFGGMSYPDFTTKFKQENVYIIEGSSRYKENFGGITSSNIGSLAYGLFLYFEAKNIYLLGLDFATDQETGQTHADIHSHTRKVDLQLNEEVGGGVEAKNEIIEIEGNFQDKVYTSLLFDAMRRECNAITATYKTDKSHSFNLSNGAKIESTTPLQPTDITLDETIDKHKLYKELREIFDARSENFLTEKEREDIQKRLEYYDSVIEVLQKHLTLAKGDLNQYHYNLLGTFYNILSDDFQNKHTSDMNYIITLYLQFVSGYIFDLINTKEIKNKKKLIKQLDKVVIPQIIHVIQYFKDTMESLLKDIQKKR
jgi:hypothetical protein